MDTENFPESLNYYLDSISIKNFRTLKNIKIDFSELTFLFGDSGSGKSCLLKALLFLSKNLVPDINTGVTSYLIGDHIDLGGFVDVVSFGNIEDTITLQLDVVTTRRINFIDFFEIELDSTKECNYQFSLRIEFGHCRTGQNLKCVELKDKDSGSFVKYEFNIAYKELSDVEKGHLLDIYGFNDPLELADVEFESIYRARKSAFVVADEIEKRSYSFGFNPELSIQQLGRIYRIDKDALTVFRPLDASYVQHVGLFHNGEPISDVEGEILKEKLDSSVTRISGMFSDFLTAGLSQCLNFALMPSTREIPGKIFIVSEGQNFDMQYYGIPKALRTTNDIKQINQMLRVFDFNLDLTTESSAEIFKMLLTSEGSKLNITNQSSGFIQLFPIIVYCLSFDLRSKYNSLLIEQPELHLHAKLQSRLAVLLKEFLDKNSEVHSASGELEIMVKRSIIETHSEHLIRKIQVLIAKGELDREKVGVWYFKKVDGVTKVEKMEIDENGLFKHDWPDGFFDDSVDLTMELFEALRKRKN